MLLMVMALWITEAVPLPVGGLIGVVVAVLLDVAPADEVLTPFGSSTIFTFIGAFIIAQAMLTHGLARRFAFRILAIRGVGNSTGRTVVAFGLITCALSAFVSNTATVAMLLPTAIAILDTVAGATGRSIRRASVALLLMLAYGASVGGLLTPVGSPPNLIGRGFIEEATGRPISFFDWMATRCRSRRSCSSSSRSCCCCSTSRRCGDWTAWRSTSQANAPSWAGFPATSATH